MTSDIESAEQHVVRWLREPGPRRDVDGTDFGPLAGFAALDKVRPCLNTSIERFTNAYRRRDAQVRALSEAQLQSNDQLLAIGALTSLVATVFDDDDTWMEMLDVARSLTDSRMVTLTTPRGVLAHDRAVALAAGPTDHALQVRLEEASSGVAKDNGRQTHDGGLMVTARLRRRGAEETDVTAEPVGVLGFARIPGSPFTTDDLQVIETIATTFALGLTLHLTHQSSLARAALEQEHEIASRIAQSSLSGHAHDVPGIDTSDMVLPAHVSGGDFTVTVATGKHLWFAVGDVSGKGLPAAIVMARVVSTVRAAFVATPDFDVAKAWDRIESQLFEHLDELGLFVTIAIGCADGGRQTIDIANAGHSPIVLVRNGRAELVGATAPPLGVVGRIRPTRETIPLPMGDVLILASDGLTEQTNAYGVMYGYDRFLDLCETVAATSAEATIADLFASIETFAAGEVPGDDRSALVIRTTGG